jgi:hypothetical protein
MLVAAFFYDPEKFYTLPDHVHRYDGSRTTFLRPGGAGRVAFPSDLRIFSVVPVSSAVLLISSLRDVDLPVIPFS